MFLRKLSVVIFIILIIGCAGSNAGAGTNGINFAELKKLIQENTEDYILVDVRTQAEYTDGHIPTAVLIPYDVIAQILPTTNKDALIIVYCRSGRRSGIAKNALAELGYTNLLDFGAIANWKTDLKRGTLP
ncbi:MAG: rhodanese-like domain-containing protein [Spirochaetales bacterium]|nr:rhodanese-like domain-containing protein [Spirochaetales bacterium]